MNEPIPDTKEPIPEFAPPFFVYLTFLVAALAIGSERSCSGGLGFYALLGLAGLLILLVCPFFVSRQRGPIPVASNARLPHFVGRMSEA